MFYLITFILIFLLIISNYILIGEELLIILATIIWMDAAGNLLYRVLQSEVELKSNDIEVKYLWFLGKKKEIKLDLKTVYIDRQQVEVNFSNFEFFNTQVVKEHALRSLFSSTLFLLNTKFFNINLKQGHFKLTEKFLKEINYISRILIKTNIYIQGYLTIRYIFKTKAILISSKSI